MTHAPPSPPAHSSGSAATIQVQTEAAAADAWLVIQRWGKELGFQQLGITDLDLSAYSAHLQNYLERGFHGDMGYLARNKLKRLNPAELVPGTARVISARMNYLPEDTQPLQVLNSPELGYVSRYALGRDYHKVLRKRLGQLASRINTQFEQHGSEQAAPALRAFTDSAPVLEKALGTKAGLGWIGKHTLLLNEQAGSWFFLGEVFTSLPLPINTRVVKDACGNCSACMTVCPTDAIIAPQTLDARRCISYLTIEFEGVIPKELRAPMGNRVFGCDDCQLYCPWNRDVTSTQEPDFTPRANLDGENLLRLFSWSAKEFDEHTRGSPIRRISHEQWQRNIAIALGNGPATPEAMQALNQRLATASDVLAEHLHWALGRLQESSKKFSR